MIFSMAKDEFAHAGAAASQAAARGDTRELASLLFECDGDGITVSATDMDMSVKVRCTGMVEEPGCALLPAAKLSKMAHTLPDKPVTVTADGGAATVKCGRVKFALVSLDADDYPGIRSVEGDVMKLAADDFARISKGIAPLASNDQSRGVLQCVRFEADGGTLTAVATDTYKLATVKVPCVGGFTAEVPSQLFAMAKPEGDVTMRCGGNCVALDTGAVEWTTRCIVGTYPRWQVLMKPAAGAATVDVKELRAAANRAGIVSKYVDFNLADGKLSLAARDDGGQIIDELDVEQTGDDMRFTLDTTYLASTLQAFDGPRVTLLQSERPVLLHEGATDALVMTMRR